MINPLPLEQLQRQAAEDAASALSEDLGDGDLTDVVVGPRDEGTASIICREDGLLCGSLWVEAVFSYLDGSMKYDWRYREGQELTADKEVLQLNGNLRALLSGERTALNFLQTLSGTATAAHRLCQQQAQGRPILLDTRKTLPLLRVAQKHAVHLGGMTNHRLGLWDMALLKENHIRAAGSMKSAVLSVQKAHPSAPLGVEVENLHELREALELNVERVLLDNFSDEDLATALEMTDGSKVQLEVSGGIDSERLVTLKKLQPDYASIGAVTKHLRALDFSMRVTATKG